MSVAPRRRRRLQGDQAAHLTGFEGLLPDAVAAMLADTYARHAVRYAATLHFNVS